MVLIFVKIAGVICGMVFGIGLACYVGELINGRYRKEFISRGYDAAVRDIIRYGFYYGADGERYEVENIRILNDHRLCPLVTTSYSILYDGCQ